MPNSKPKIVIYTDGGADPNPGPGGWGVILIDRATGRKKELSGGEAQTTNNRMELTAAIEALSALKKPCDIQFYTDSEYLRRGITEWLPGWQVRGWRRKGKEILNVDLWKQLGSLIEPHAITWEWVKGHSGNRYNERADQLATQAIRAQYGGQPRGAVDAEVYLLVTARGGAGYWGALVRRDGEEDLVFGYEEGTTSNRLDLTAAVQALGSLPEGAVARIYSRSDYLRNGATRWVAGWKRRDWKTKSGAPVKNQDLWMLLDDHLSARRATWPKVDEDMLVEFEDIGERLREAIDEDRRAHGHDDGFFPA